MTLKRYNHVEATTLDSDQLYKLLTMICVKYGGEHGFELTADELAAFAAGPEHIMLTDLRNSKIAFRIVDQTEAERLAAEERRKMS